MAYDVKSIQEALSILGKNPGSVDGAMGPNTENAIKAFQKSAGVAADGIVGPNTATKMAEALGKASVRAASLKGYFEGGGASAADDM
ncbi:MAG: peptidoglycan-binding protein [Leptospiraceae bacterium]|nr:peptidoglycan-binding protein [Leptospiraceae bacterium]MCB1201609.1 peptidoglycan-binding protein [Leptospiraceae bacterium]